MSTNKSIYGELANWNEQFRQPVQPRNISPFETVKKFNSFRKDPITFMLQNKGISIPQEYRNNPEGAIQYLLNNGQMTQEQLNYVISVAQRMGIQV